MNTLSSKYLDMRADIINSHFKLFMEICGLKTTSTSAFHSEDGGRWSHYFDHRFECRSKYGLLIFDNPYIPSRHLENEYMLISYGFKIVHLPLEMSLHVRNECQPRLTAPPNSRTDVEKLRDLLVLSKFETPFTTKWTDEYLKADKEFCRARLERNRKSIKVMARLEN